MPFSAFSNNSTKNVLDNKTVSEDSLKKTMLFQFGTDLKIKKGISVTKSLQYKSDLGYGFDFNTESNLKLNSNSFSIEKPVYFSVKLPEGNYQVEVVLGNPQKDLKTTIKAESRRLMVNEFIVAKGKSAVQIFNVNVRNPKINDNLSVTLKDREKDILDWDDKLTLEFLGETAVQSIKITKKDNLTVLYLAGDSTVTDQDVEPWASWSTLR